MNGLHPFPSILFFFTSLPSIDCTQNALRLLGGNSRGSGRVEICHNSVWGGFCGSWDDADAQVICRQLGFSPIGLLIHVIAMGNL